MRCSLRDRGDFQAPNWLDLQRLHHNLDDENERCSGFENMKTLQKFSSVHAQVHNHFNQERHLIIRQVYKQRRLAALAEWRVLAA